MKRPDRIQISDGQMTPRRAISVGFVAALHIVVIWALLNGFAKKIVEYVPPSLKVIDIAPVQPKTVQPPPPTTLVKPTDVPTVPQPVIDIQQPQQPATTVNVQPQQPNPPAVTDASVSGLTSTHSTPPYPPNARRLSEQGSVTLKIMVTAQGAVSDAQVVQTSGYPDLDQTAVEWVKAHWRYKPAMQGGVAVASVTQAIVKFDLKNAR